MFLEALYSTMRTNSPVANTKRVCELTVASQFENPAVRTMPTNLLYLQTMILMGLEADNHGPATMRGQLGLPRAAWLGAAVGLAYNLKLHNNRNQEQSVNGDSDSDEKLGRRAWVVLVILDRWHAISTSSPLFIPDSSVVFVPEDQKLLGLAPFHIARKSESKYENLTTIGLTRRQVSPAFWGTSQKRLLSQTKQHRRRRSTLSSQEFFVASSSDFAKAWMEFGIL